MAKKKKQKQIYKLNTEFWGVLAFIFGFVSIFSLIIFLVYLPGNAGLKDASEQVVNWWSANRFWVFSPFALFAFCMYKGFQEPVIDNKEQKESVVISNNVVKIKIRKEIYNHIKTYLKNKDYYHAVSESYKVVRTKLEAVSGCEKATDLYDWANWNPKGNQIPKITDENCEKIFGCKARNRQEDDFFIAAGYLHLVIQFLRNEKSHMQAHEIDSNLAIHYLSLASLAYDLISRNDV